MRRYRILLAAIYITLAGLSTIPAHGATIELTDQGWSGRTTLSDCVKGWADDQWKLTLTSPADVTFAVEGLHCPGDYYKVAIGSTVIGTTPNLSPPWGCTYSGQQSKGSFTKYLKAGTHLIRVRNAGLDGHSAAEIMAQTMCPGAVSMTISLQRIEAGGVSFNWGTGSGAISLKARVNQADVAVTAPEYVKGSKNDPAAYVRNSAVTVQASFQAVAALGEVTVWAEGSLGGLSKRLVDFGGSTASPTVSFTARNNLPDRIGVNHITWKWKYKTSTGETRDMGQTSHVVYTTYKAPLATPVYRELMGWTSDWAAGGTNEKQIVDATIKKLARLGLQYGLAAWSTARILDVGGGMCGGWSRMFSDMAAAQGVTVTRKCFILQNDAAASPEMKWDSIVVKAAGLNQSEPVPDPYTWRDVDKKSAYPYPLYLGDASKKDDVNYVVERRWAFFSPYDGHCIDFLEYNGKVYLYDPSFGTGPFVNTFTTVPDGSMAGTALTAFRANYHDKAVDYMQGIIQYRDCATCEPRTNTDLYLDVKTRNIPALRDQANPETFEIHYIWY